MAKEKKDQLIKLAENYRQISKEIKELEKKREPIKKMLLDHAELMELDNIDLGPVSLEKRTTEKAIIDLPAAISPDWLWRMQDNGFGSLLKVSIDPKKVDAGNEKQHGYLEEIGYQRKESVTYAIRINP